MPDLLSLAHSAQTNARMTVLELGRGDLVMAEGHAILLAQQAEELLAGISTAKAAQARTEPRPGQAP